MRILRGKCSNVKSSKETGESCRVILYTLQRMCYGRGVCANAEFLLCVKMQRPSQGTLYKQSCVITSTFVYHDQWSLVKTGHPTFLKT